jgi:hypothetical protein
MAKEMTRFMESHYRSMPIDNKRYTGERWSKMLIRNLWNMVLKLWENRNEIIHGKQRQDGQRTEHQRLQHRIRKYYEMKDLLEQQDKEKIFYKELDELIQEDSRYLKAWLKLAQRIFSAAKREQVRPRNERKLMETYFAWRPTKKTPRRQTKEQRAPDETHPD